MTQRLDELSVTALSGNDSYPTGWRTEVQFLARPTIFLRFRSCGMWHRVDG